MKQKTRSKPRQGKNSPSKATHKALIPEVLDAEEAPEDSDDEAELTDEDIEAEAESGGGQIVPAPARPVPSRSGTDEDEETARRERALSPSDPLRRYMEEAKRYPLLEPEEEYRLAVRLKETGDIEAAKALVQANLRLVAKIAFDYRNFYYNVLDLIQEGNIGLMKAVSKFDPTKGARLGYYASWWIRSYILKYLLENFRLVKVGTTQAQKKLFYHLMREKERLEAQGLLAGPKLLAERLDVREKDVVEMEQRLSSRGAELSLDAPLNSEDGNSGSFLDTLPHDQTGADDALAQDELLNLIRERLPAFRKQLNEKELRILTERLLAEEPKTLQEVADQYGLTRERARQIEVKVIQKFREFLKSDLAGSLDSDDL